VTPAEIKRKRTDAILQELIPEAIAQMGDARLRELDVIEVRCAKGRSDAKVYVDPHDYSEAERDAFLKQLKKARPIIEDYCMKDQGWFRCPKLAFFFDDQLKQTQNIEALFNQLEREKHDES
jgi:ribosome-binding factor A